MPLLKLETSVDVSTQQRTELLPALSRILAEGIGKPEQYVMVTIAAAAISMAGDRGDAAFCDIRSIGGLEGEVNRRLSRRICDVLQTSLGIAPDRVYLNFSNVSAADWGWSGRTFG
jgi:phenylpyruvate tautomerase PptA (4-oxalocrotonate tautomerase family)